MNKRTFLKSFVASAVFGLALLRTKGAAAKKYALSRTQLPALNKIGGAVTIKLKGKQVLLVRLSKDEIRGFDALCTHQECPLVFNKNKLSCKCHGSYFDLQGNVKKGPANKSLTVYPVKITADKLIVG